MPSYSKLLETLNISTISFSTVFCWLKQLGYRYDENKRCYYTNGHGRNDVIQDREDRFLGDYFHLERKCHRWVQLPENIAQNLESIHSNFPKNSYYGYSVDDVNYRE